MFVPKSVTRFPGEGNSRPFAASTGGDLVTPAVPVFAPANSLLDPGAAGFAAGTGGTKPPPVEAAKVRELPSPGKRVADFGTNISVEDYFFGKVFLEVF